MINPAVGDIEIGPLDATRWPALSRLFEQGGDPSRCWCTFWRFTASESARMSTDDNRAWLEGQALGTAAGIDEPAGLVAQFEGRAVAWISVAPRETLSRLSRSRGIPLIEGDSVWSIMCFVVDKDVRGRGLSDALLTAAAAFAVDRGAASLEAYPVAVPAGSRLPAAAAYTGIEATFISAGYRRIAETTSSAAGFPRVVVRRDA